MTKRLNALLVQHGMQDRFSVHFLARQMLSRGRPVHRVRGKQSVYSGLLLKVHAEDPLSVPYNIMELCFEEDNPRSNIQ